MCEFQVDRGTGWGPLAFDTTPNYTDSTAHPATLTHWKYRPIYHADNTQVGLWSVEVSVTVGGCARRPEPLPGGPGGSLLGPPF